MKEHKFECLVLKYDVEGPSDACKQWTYAKDVFKNQDKMVVPLIWNYRHYDVNSVIGNAILENREDGMYAYCKLLLPNDDQLNTILTEIKEKQLYLAPYVIRAKLYKKSIIKARIGYVTLIFDRIDNDKEYIPIIKD